ncbi:MAG TPA: hypothetical protein VGH88_13140 [Streptosporangiaceae bacterium]
MTANAIPVTRGSSRSGRANRVVSGATASQPANDSIRVAAARPTAVQPCGANGAQLAAWADGADPATATTTTTTSSPTSPSWAAVLARTPPRARPTAASSSAPTTAARISWPPPARSVT